MRKFVAWLRSWATTLHIMISERETYRALREPGEPAGDEYIEVFRPGA